MDGIRWWELGLLVVAGFWALTALLRLMIAHRDAEVAEVKRQLDEYQRQKKAARQKAKDEQATAAPVRGAGRRRPAA